MSGQNTTPLNTLEKGPATARPYTEYWSEFPDTIGLAKPSDIEKTRRMGRYLNDLTGYVIRGAEPHNIELYTDIFTDEPQDQTIANAVAEWDRSVGTFNSYREGQGDLLRGAGLLLHANFSGDPEEFSFPSTASCEVYERFMSLFGNNSLKQQKPTPDLLLAGQLVHKAGLIEANPDRREHLLAASQSVYDRIYNDPDAVWIDRLTAGQYRSDIHFEWLAEEMREAVKYQDTSYLADLRDLAIDLIRESATDFQQAGRLLDRAKESQEAVGGYEGHEWVGFMAQVFRRIAARDMIHVRSKPTLAARYGIRGAFEHEDRPRNLKLYPKQSFDDVVQRRDINGNIAETTPVQVWLQSYRHKPRPGKEEGAYGRIPCIVITGLSHYQMKGAIDNLLVAYEKGHMQRGIGALASMQEIFGAKVDDRLVAAPQ